MYFQDLSPYSLRGSSRGKSLNIGWLSREHPFPIGDTPDEFRRVLNMLAADPINLCMGWHDCEFCETPPQKLTFWRRAPTRSNSAAKGNGEIHVPAAHGDIVYAAPQLVAHYVEEHRYLPPSEFVAAVLAYKPPVIPWEAIRSDWQNQLPVLDGEWNQWRIFSDGSLLAVIPGDTPSAALDLLQRHLRRDMKDGALRDFTFEVSRSYRSTSGKGVAIEPIRHAISCEFTKSPRRPPAFSSRLI